MTNGKKEIRITKPITIHCAYDDEKNDKEIVNPTKIVIRPLESWEIDAFGDSAVIVYAENGDEYEFSYSDDLEEEYGVFKSRIKALKNAIKRGAKRITWDGMMEGDLVIISGY